MSDNKREEGGLFFQGQTESIFKVIVIGDPSVGKTSLLTKFATNKFEEVYLPTVGVNIVKETIELKENSATIKLMFWEVAGQWCSEVLRAV